MVAFLAKDVCGNFVLLLTVAHGRAFQWRSEQRCRGFTPSITTFCVLAITGLLLFAWILYWHPGFYLLARNHFSQLTDFSGRDLSFLWYSVYAVTCSISTDICFPICGPPTFAHMTNKSIVGSEGGEPVVEFYWGPSSRAYTC